MFSRISEDWKVYLGTLWYVLAFHPSHLTMAITLGTQSWHFSYLLPLGGGGRNRGGGNRQTYFHGVLVFHFLIFLNHFEMITCKVVTPHMRVSSCLCISAKLSSNKRKIVSLRNKTLTRNKGKKYEIIPKNILTFLRPSLFFKLNVELGSLSVLQCFSLMGIHVLAQSSALYFPF